MSTETGYFHPNGLLEWNKFNPIGLVEKGGHYIKSGVDAGGHAIVGAYDVVGDLHNSLLQWETCHPAVMDALELFMLTDGGEGDFDPAPAGLRIAGSGRVPGVLEAGPRSQSLAAINAWNSRSGIEFVFDPSTGEFAMGEPATWLKVPGSPHEQLAAVIGADPATVVGGIVRRGSDGSLSWNEQSGHFWQNWTAEIREQFVTTLRSYGGAYRWLN